MTVQEATEAPNINSFQMHSSFGEHESRPGRILLADSMPPWVRSELRRMGYELTFEERTSGPINAIPTGPNTRHNLGRLQQPRRRLRHRLVTTN